MFDDSVLSETESDALPRRVQTADKALPTSDDADLLAEGATILARAKQSAEDRAARNVLEDEYRQSYGSLRNAILLMEGEYDHARFHGRVYDGAEHLPRLAELLVNYFQVLQKSEHICDLGSVNEDALLQCHKPNDKSGLPVVCLTYARRLFQAGVTGASKEHVARKLREVNENEQLAGVWRWIVRLGWELGPDKWRPVGVNRELKTPARPEETKPAWDKSKRLLTYDGCRLRKYLDPAEAQIAVLDTFQELSWDDAVDSPFPNTKQGKSRLKNTIKNLNKGLEQKGVVEFYGDGSGTHVCWRRL